MVNLKDLVVDGVLHQDKYTGTTYQYETSSLTIVGHNGETGANRKRYIVRCSVCSDDKELHGEGYFISLKGHLDRGTKPCACAIGRPQETYINLLKDGDNTVAIKFGVANLALERAKQQNTRSVFDIVNYGVWKYEDVISCRSAERECLKTLPTGVVSKRDMSDGYTETTTVAHLEQVIYIFEKNGGVRV